MLWILMLAAGQLSEEAVRVKGWAKKAKPITECRSPEDCDAKWQRATAWIKSNSRFQIAVDQPTLLSTYGAVYANTGLSFVIERRRNKDGVEFIAARGWCGNAFTCKPKAKDALATLKREIER